MKSYLIFLLWNFISKDSNRIMCPYCGKEMFQYSLGNKCNYNATCLRVIIGCMTIFLAFVFMDQWNPTIPNCDSDTYQNYRYLFIMLRNFQNVQTTSIVDPEPDPQGSLSFYRIRICDPFSGV
jgi:hypothetical protein